MTSKFLFFVFCFLIVQEKEIMAEIQRREEEKREEKKRKEMAKLVTVSEILRQVPENFTYARL